MTNRSSFDRYGPRMITVLLASAVLAYGEIYALGDSASRGTNPQSANSGDSAGRIVYSYLLEKHQRAGQETLRIRATQVLGAYS